jgi:hypothetical protein
MHAKHPKIAARWDKKYGKAPHGSGKITDEDLLRGFIPKTFNDPTNKRHNQ